MLRTTATELPDRATGAPVTAALPVIPTVPVGLVPAAPAVYCTLIVHTAPATSVPAQSLTPAATIATRFIWLISICAVTIV